MTFFAQPAVATNEAHQSTLDIDLIRAEDPGLEFRVGSFERYRRALLAKPLQSCFFLLDERNDYVAILGGVAAADDDRITIMNAGLDH